MLSKSNTYPTAFAYQRPFAHPAASLLRVFEHHTHPGIRLPARAYQTAIASSTVFAYQAIYFIGSITGCRNIISGHFASDRVLSFLKIRPQNYQTLLILKTDFARSKSFNEIISCEASVGTSIQRKIR